MTNELRVHATSSPLANQTAFPAEELERLRLTSIQRRESVIRDWLYHQSTETLLALLKENAHDHGFVIAHSESERVQREVLKAGRANRPEAAFILMSSEHEDVREEALRLWALFSVEFPELVTGMVRELFKADVGE